MEYFDVVDANRDNLNYTKRRGDELLENEYNVGIEVWIFNNNKLLMTKRSLNKSHPGEWEVPGGCSQTEETSIDTLVREIKEEIGITLTNKDYTYLDTELYKKQFVDIYKSNIEIDINKVVLQEDEVMDINFFTKEEFLKLTKTNMVVASVYNRYKRIEDKLDW